MESLLKTINENKELLIISAPFVLQGLSWLVKKSPWGWDDDLLSWCIKNKAGIKQVAEVMRKRKKK